MMTIYGRLKAVPLLYLFVAVTTPFLEGVEAHFTLFKNHFDFPPTCSPGFVKSYTTKGLIPVNSSANGAPCIIRKAYMSSDKTCTGPAYQTVTLIADQDCWKADYPNSTEYYKIHCATDGAIAGQMLCNKGCTDCVETNFEAGGFSDSFIDLIIGTGRYDKGFTNIPTDGTCTNWNAGSQGWDKQLITGEPGEPGSEWNGAEVSIDYTFEGQCVSNPYEGAFDDPEQFIMQWLNDGKAPSHFIVVGIIVVLVSMFMSAAIYTYVGDVDTIADVEGESAGCCGCTRTSTLISAAAIFDILQLAGSSIFFLGLFVLDSRSSIITGFVVVLVIVCYAVAKQYNSKENVGGRGSDSLRTTNGTVTSTKYMDFERPLAKLCVLFASQIMLIYLLITEMINFWGDEGAEYDQDFGNFEARHLLFFFVSILLQPGQYDELFGENAGTWTEFFKLCFKDDVHDVQVLVEEYNEDPIWKTVSTKKHGQPEWIFRWILMSIGGFIIPMLMLIFTPVLLTFSATALDFVMNAFALAFIGAMDNGDTIRIRIALKAAERRTSKQSIRLNPAPNGGKTESVLITDETTFAAESPSKTESTAPNGGKAESVLKTDKTTFEVGSPSKTESNPAFSAAIISSRSNSLTGQGGIELPE